MEQKSQKTVEDYRNIIKLLKLKVIKLQNKNKELEQKLYEPFDDSYISHQDFGDVNRGKPKNDPASQTEGILMQDLCRGCRKLGLSTEGVFRAADKEQTQKIPLEEFKLFLKNLKLELTQGQVNRLANMADEDCKGVISQQNWQNLLEMYEVQQEKSIGQDRSFAQQAVFKIAELFLKKEISPEEGFDQMAKGHSTITNERLKAYCMNEDPSMTDKQCQSGFNHLDFNKRGRLIKVSFVGEIRKYMRIMAQDKGLSISQFCPPQEQALTVQKPVSSRPAPPVSSSRNLMAESMKSPSKSQKLKPKGANLNKSQLEASQLIQELDVEKGEISKIVDQLQRQGVDVGKLFQAMLDDLVNPLAGIKIKDVYEAFSKTYPRVPRELQQEFFHCLDSSGNGGADFQECLEFYCQYMDIEKQDSWPIELVFGMKNQHLKATLKFVDEYLEEFQINTNTSINPKTFQYQAKKMFNVDQLDHKEAKEKEKKIMQNMNEIANQVQGKGILETKIKKGKITKKKQSQVKRKKKVDVNLDQFQQKLEKVREQQGKEYQLDETDYFIKCKLEDDTNAAEIQTPWCTILNDEISCLIKCTEIVNELKQKKLEKWTDPEFGPNDSDKVASASLYFADNDIPPGAPTPEEVIWSRPEDLVQLLIDMGETYKDDQGNDHEYDNKVPCFMEGGASSNDVKQSQYLGNCWFISALSIISQNDNLLNGRFDVTEESVQDISNNEAKGMSEGVYPPMFHFLEQYGIYVIKFFKNAGWRYVIIDDRIPCKEGGEVIYGQCKQKNELWVPIIEKAYAKLHNCYQALIAGDIAQGLADMTGMIADRTKLPFSVESQAEAKDKEEADKLWERLKEAKRNQTMMGCSAEGETEGFIMRDGESTGVMTGHAYSLLDVIELPHLKGVDGKKGRGYHRLLRIRNPWGHGEWTFKWSDSAEGYKDETFKHKADLDKYYEQERENIRKWNKAHPDDQRDESEIEVMELGVDDGTFLMNFKEWRNLFANLFMCINFPDEWSGRRIKGQWTEQLSAGAPTKNTMEKYAKENPQYIFSLNAGKETTVYINQSQRDGRLFWGEKFPYERVTTFMLLCVFKLDKGEQGLQKFDKKKMLEDGTSRSFILRREVDTENMKLPDGDYAIIPCAKQAGYKGDFTLNIYFDCKPEQIKFKQAFGRGEANAQEIKEEEEKVADVSPAMRDILQEVAKNELKMIQERGEKRKKKK